MRAIHRIRLIFFLPFKIVDISITKFKHLPLNFDASHKLDLDDNFFKITHPINACQFGCNTGI